jgi:membrane-associated phospholipid phosphatase
MVTVLAPMYISRRSLVLLFFMMACFSCMAQDTVFHKEKPVRQFIVPSTAILYGVASLSLQPLKDINLFIRRNTMAASPHPTNIDDYLQYVPALAGHALSIAGIKGEHRLFDRLLIDAMAGGAEVVAVFTLKRITNEERPDHSDHYSFPSNHVAVAFASAELLRMEYAKVSPWYGVGGYAVAGLTSYLRLYNDEHWFGDVIAGAGIGLFAARASNLVYPWVRKHIIKRKALVRVPQ